MKTMPHPKVSDALMDSVLTAEDQQGFDPALRRRLEADHDYRAARRSVNSVRAGLKSLPEMEPPPGAWKAILNTHRSRNRQAQVRRFAWPALAAALGALALAVLLAPRGPVPPSSPASPVADSVPSQLITVADLAPIQSLTGEEIHRLRTRSMELDRLLGRMPQGPRVMRADTAGLIAELEDRVAVQMGTCTKRLFQWPITTAVWPAMPA